MILVTLGTQDKEFKRILIEVERLIEVGKINEKVIAQTGNTKFETKLPNSKMELIKFTTPKQLNELIQDSSFIITHGGVGTIIEGIDLGKKIIAVPRLKKYKEHVNDHQLQIIQNFDNKGYIIGTRCVEDIENSLDRVEKFVPRRYESNNKNFIENLESKIEEL